MTTPDLGLRLRNRLGPEACEDLSDAFEEVQIDMLTITTERFDGRLLIAAAELRAEMTRTQSELRQEIAVGDAELRIAFIDGLSKIRTEMAGMRVDVLRWSFVFWVGEVAAIATLLAFMLHSR
jgi:hypothetical protein